MPKTTDLVLRKVVLEEWIEELTFTQKLFDNFDLTGTGLTPVRKEILAYLERAKQFAESKKPDYEAFSDVAAESPVRPQARAHSKH